MGKKKSLPWALLAAGRDLRVHLISEFLSSSEMTVCSPPCAPAGACSGLSSGPRRPGSSLPCCLPPLCCQRCTTFLQCCWSTPSIVSARGVWLHACLSTQKCIWATLPDITVKALEAKLLTICSLTSEFKSIMLLIEFSRRCLTVASEEFGVCSCSNSHAHRN